MIEASSILSPVSKHMKELDDAIGNGSSLSEEKTAQIKKRNDELDKIGLTWKLKRALPHVRKTFTDVELKVEGFESTVKDRLHWTQRVYRQMRSEMTSENRSGTPRSRNISLGCRSRLLPISI